VSLQNAGLSNPTAGTTPGTTGLRTLIATSVPFDTPRTQQWNIGYQRQLYSRGSIDVGYVGSHGDHLIQPVDINRPSPAAVVAAGNLNLAAPFPGYTVSTSTSAGGINMRQTTAYSNYWGILTQFRHEGGRAGSYTLNYTLSRSRATASNDRDGVDIPQNPNDLKAEYADARTDRRHIFNATYILELPFFRDSSNGLLKASLGGWQIAGYTTLQSGPPVSRVVESTNNDRRGMYADQVGDPGAGDQQFPFWINAAAFQPAQDGNYGIPDHYQIWSSFAYAWDITHDPIFLQKASEALGVSDFVSGVQAHGVDNWQNKAALLALAQSMAAESTAP